MKLIMAQSLILSIAIPLTLSSCNNDDDDTTDTGAKVRETPADLRGSWLSPCQSSFIPGMQSIRRQYIFNAIGDFDKIERYYIDSQCQNIGSTYKTIGTVDAKGSLSEDKSVLSINLTVNDAFLTAVGPDQVASFNAVGLCGLKNWAANQEVSIINMSCGGVDTRKGDVIFDVYSKRGDALYFGKTSLFLAKDSGDDRPVNVDADSPYTKQ